MKRSETIEKLKRPVAIIAGGIYTSAEIADTADALLEMIERAGMLPPEIPEPGQPLHPGNTFVNEWESE